MSSWWREGRQGACLSSGGWKKPQRLHEPQTLSAPAVQLSASFIDCLAVLHVLYILSVMRNMTCDAVESHPAESFLLLFMQHKAERHTTTACLQWLSTALSHVDQRSNHFKKEPSWGHKDNQRKKSNYCIQRQSDFGRKPSSIHMIVPPMVITHLGVQLSWTIGPWQKYLVKVRLPKAASGTVPLSFSLAPLANTTCILKTYLLTYLCTVVVCPAPHNPHRHLSQAIHICLSCCEPGYHKINQIWCREPFVSFDKWFAGKTKGRLTSVQRKQTWMASSCPHWEIAEFKARCTHNMKLWKTLLTTAADGHLSDSHYSWIQPASSVWFLLWIRSQRTRRLSFRGKPQTRHTDLFKRSNWYTYPF